MIKRKDKNGVRTKVKAIGRIPWGYDRVVEKQGDSWYVPDTDAFKCLDRAIMQIREGGHSVRKVATWLENETSRKLSATRLHKLAWTEEELETRRKTRRRSLSPKQRKIEDLKNTEKQTRIKADQAKRRLNKALDRGVVSEEPLDFTDAVAKEPEVVFKSNPGPQANFLAANEREVFYGGARGGGKTYSLLIAPLRFIEKPMHRALLIRRSMPELRDVIFQTQQLYPKAAPGAKFKAQENTWYFPSGARIEFGYCENLQDVLRYQGQSYSWIGVDELPQYANPDIWHFLRSSLRTTDPSIPLHMRATGNPGNIGSAWVKKMFIEPAEPNTRITEKIEYEVDGRTLTSELTRKFISASVWDNPYLTQDASYVSMLASLPEVKRKQFLYGDWDVVEEGAFPEFDKTVHTCESFEIPNGWTRIRAADFGYAAHSAILWGAVDFDGCLWIYRELYVNRMTADKLGQMIMEVEADDGRIQDALLDSSCWAKRGDVGPSIAETINREGCRFRPSDRSPGSRVAGKIELHKRFTIDEELEEPKIKILHSCRNLISQIAALPVDPRNPEDVDTKAEDHLYDALRYMIMSRPTNIRVAYENTPKTRYQPSDSTFGY
jgi:phage terminase large subunit